MNEWLDWYVTTELFLRISVGGVLGVFAFGPLFGWLDRNAVSAAPVLVAGTLAVLSLLMAVHFIFLALLRLLCWVVTGA